MIAFPVPGKAKSAEICQAFIDGAGESGRASDAAVFYGVVDANAAAWQAVKASGRDFYFIDNSYFDQSRATHLRVTRNRLQHPGLGASDGSRFAALGVPILPWRQDGEALVLAPQSEPFMRLLAGFEGDWAAWVQRMLADPIQARPRILREWRKDKIALGRTLADDLANAWALVTHSSAAAVTAVLAGVPVFSLSAGSAAWEMSGTSLFNEPQRAFPNDAERLQWASVLADNQWTLAELRDGTCWAALARQVISDQ